jgi:hypothetical protein
MGAIRLALLWGWKHVYDSAVIRPVGSKFMQTSPERVFLDEPRRTVTEKPSYGNEDNDHWLRNLDPALAAIETNRQIWRSEKKVPTFKCPCV